MAVASAKLFWEKLSSDKELQQKIQELTTEERDELVKSMGYDFTHDELKGVIKEAMAANGTELSDEDLDSIAGGFSCGSFANCTLY